MVKKKAILIGFEFNIKQPSNSFEQAQELPGVIFDLYRSYQHLMKMSVDRLLVITDITNDISSTAVVKNISNGKIDVGILSFIEILKQNQQYYLYKNVEEMLTVISDFLKPLTNTSSTIPRSFTYFYYTGHLVNKHQQQFIILPTSPSPSNQMEYQNQWYGNKPSLNTIDKYHPIYKSIHTQRALEKNSDIHLDNRLLITELREVVLSSIEDNSQLLMVMDCCHTTDFGMPFVLTDGIYQLIPKPDIIFVRPEIIVITSTRHGKYSYARNDGSVFSEYFYQQLNDNPHLPLDKIMTNVLDQTQHIGKPHHGNVYSSRPDLLNLWSWTYCHSKNIIRYDFVDDMVLLYPG